MLEAKQSLNQLIIKKKVKTTLEHPEGLRSIQESQSKVWYLNNMYYRPNKKKEM